MQHKLCSPRRPDEDRVREPILGRCTARGSGTGGSVAVQALKDSYLVVLVLLGCSALTYNMIHICRAEDGQVFQVSLEATPGRDGD